MQSRITNIAFYGRQPGPINKHVSILTGQITGSSSLAGFIPETVDRII